MANKKPKPNDSVELSEYKTTAEPKAYAGGVPVFCAHDAIVPLKDLKPNPRNPNQHPPEQIKALGAIIKATGWRAPITVSTRSGFIVKGHGRMMAAQLEDMTAAPVDYQEYASEAEELADLTADNRIAELATIDNKLLADIFVDIDTGEIPFMLSGYTEEEYGDIVTALSEAIHDADLTDADEVPEPPEEERVITQVGDIWMLGNHRLICGDSTDRQTIAKLMNGKKADLVFTDPPYGMGKERDGVLNDNLNYDDLLVFNKKWIPLTFEALKDNGSWYCWGNDEPLMDIYSNILKPMQEENKITFRNLLTWNKGNAQGQMSSGYRMYAIADEKCLFVMAGVQGSSKNANKYYEAWEPIRKYLYDEKQKMGWSDNDLLQITGVHTVARHCFAKSQWEFPTEQHYNEMREAACGKAFKKEYKEIKEEYDSVCAFFDNTHDNMNNVWHFDRTVISERELTGGHATPKPIALCVRAIKSSSREGEIVLDVFGGSGSTLIACEQERRACRMVELAPSWCDVIVKRYVRTTGKRDISCVRQGQELPPEVIAELFEADDVGGEQE